MKYFKQETNYTCGVACMRMVMSEFFDEIPSEDDLVPLLKTNDRVGTLPQAFIDYAESLGFKCLYGSGATMSYMETLRIRGYVVMLLVSVDVPHWVIYLGNNNNHAFFNDPFFGENRGHSMRKFDACKTGHPNFRWRVVASEFKKDAPGYDFSTLEDFKSFIAFKREDK